MPHVEEQVKQSSKSMNLTIHKWVLNAMTAPNPTQYTCFDKCNVKKQKNNHPEEVIKDILAEETPVAIVYNGVSHVVMMVSPCDLEDFVRGFSITEGIIKSLSEIYSIEVIKKDNGINLKTDKLNI